MILIVTWRKRLIFIEQKHCYDSLVPSPCCYFRLSTSLAVSAARGRRWTLGREQVPPNCRRPVQAVWAGQCWNPTKIETLQCLGHFRRTFLDSKGLLVDSSDAMGFKALDFHWNLQISGGLARFWGWNESKVNALALVQKCNVRLPFYAISLFNQGYADLLGSFEWSINGKIGKNQTKKLSNHSFTNWFVFYLFNSFRIIQKRMSK